MVYRDLPLEEAEKRFADIVTPEAAPAPEPMAVKVVAKRKTVKAFVPKNK
jgi:hypothetical protein